MAENHKAFQPSTPISGFSKKSSIDKPLFFIQRPAFNTNAQSNNLINQKSHKNILRNFLNEIKTECRSIE